MLAQINHAMFFYSVCLNYFHFTEWNAVSSIPYISLCVWCPAPNPGKSVQDPGCCTEGILNMSQHHSYSNMPFSRSSDWFEAQQVWGNTAAVSLHVVYGKTSRNSYTIRFALNKFVKEAEKERRWKKKAQLGERDLGNLQWAHVLHTESFQAASVCFVIYFKWAHRQHPKYELQMWKDRKAHLQKHSEGL